MQTKTTKLSARVLARWDAKDWNDDTMTASEYRYYAVDAEGYAGAEVMLTEDQASRYAWGPAFPNVSGGSQAGELRPPKEKSLARRVRSLVEDSGYSRREARILAKAGF